MPERESAFSTLRAIPIRLPGFVEAMLRAGTAGYPPRRRRGLIIANATGYLAAATDQMVSLTRQGLLRVDSLLPQFFLPEHTHIRYT